MTRILGLVAALALAACGGGASVSNSVPGTHLELHTTFGWITAETLQGSSGSGTWVPVDQKSLTIVLSGASFDPTKDIQFLSFADQQQILLDQWKSGLVTINFPDVAKAILGQPIASNYGDAHPTFDSGLSFGATEANGSTVYPAGQLTIGSKSTKTLTLKGLGTKPGDGFSGTLVYLIEKGAGDGAGAVTGTITINFSGTLVSQIMGVCNFSLTTQQNGGDCNPNDP